MIKKVSVNPQGSVPYNTLVGKAIESQRNAKQITQTEMAQALGIGQSAYSRLEGGQAAMSLAQLRKVASALDVSANSLLSTADKWALELERRGVEVPSEKPDNKAALLIGLGLLLALMSKN